MGSTTHPATSATGTPANTRVSYMFVDEDNYKIHRDEVFSGAITTEQRSTITAALESGEMFLPGQVGLDDLPSSDPDWDESGEDGLWHFLTEVQVVTDPPTRAESIAAFAARFTGITWDLMAASELYERG